MASVSSPSEVAASLANGISFVVSDEQRALRDLAHAFAERRMRPAADELEHSWQLPTEILAEAAAQGLTTYAIPELYGGLGADPVTSAILMEELTWGDAGLSTLLGSGHLFAGGLVAAGDRVHAAELRDEYLPRFCQAGGALGAIAFSEPSAGSDVAGIRSTARRDGDDWVLNGEKTWITGGGEFAEAILVFARTGDVDAGARGISCFVVEGSQQGISSRKLDLLGLRTSYTASLFLDDVRVPARRMLGEEGDGFAIAMDFFTGSRPQVAAAAVGIARAAFEYAVAYANERSAFGRPIANHQAIGFTLAEMGMRIEAARSLVWQACDAVANGRDAGLVGSYAKAFASDVAMRVTTEAVQVLGGAGLSEDHPTGRWMRDAKVLQIVEGTSQIQRLICSRYYQQHVVTTGV